MQLSPSKFFFQTYHVQCKSESAQLFFVVFACKAHMQVSKYPSTPTIRNRPKDETKIANVPTISRAGSFLHGASTRTKEKKREESESNE
jgi:hypothetical protein